MIMIMIATVLVFHRVFGLGGSARQSRPFSLFGLANRLTSVSAVQLNVLRNARSEYVNGFPKIVSKIYLDRVKTTSYSRPVSHNPRRLVGCRTCLVALIMSSNYCPKGIFMP